MRRIRIGGAATPMDNYYCRGKLCCLYVTFSAQLVYGISSIELLVNER